jgi:pilus assembly protein Flp/PilA
VQLSLSSDRTNDGRSAKGPAIDVDQGFKSPAAISHLVPGEVTMAKFITAAKSFVKGEEGATMVEYGLMLALIAVICIASVTVLGKNASTIFSTAAATL